MTTNAGEASGGHASAAPSPPGAVMPGAVTPDAMSPGAVPGEPARRTPAPDGSGEAAASTPGFVRRYRLPLALAVVALCLYVGSILYILLGRGAIG